MVDSKYHEQIRPDDTLGNIQDDEEALNKIDKDIARLRMRTSMNIDLESVQVNSETTDHQSLIKVLDGLGSQIVRIRQHIEMVKSQPSEARETFGPSSKVSPEVQGKIFQVVKRHKQTSTVPLDHAVVLVKHLVQAKTANLELENYIKEMQAKMNEAGVAVPPKNKPESTDDQGSDYDEEDDYDSSDSDTPIPIMGGNLMEQICNLENAANAKALGVSQVVQKSKALTKKGDKMAQSQKASSLKSKAQQQSKANLSNNSSVGKAQKRDREQQMQNKLYKIVEQAFKAQILDSNQYRKMYDQFDHENGSTDPDQQKLNENFEKMRAHYDCLTEIEASHGNLTNPSNLREVLKRNSFLLGLESNKNKQMKLELEFMQKNTQRIRSDKMSLQSEKLNQEEELELTKKKLYDIEFDFY